jgi:outer membrane protein W
MKKIILLTTIFFSSFATINAQQLSEGNSMINLGVGLSSYYTSGSGYNMSLPPVEGTFEYMITENISVGAFVGAYGSKYETNFDIAYNFSSKFSYIDGGALGNFHFVNDDKFNAYVGAKLGYVSVSTSTDSNDDYLNELLETLDYTDSGIIYGVQLGGRYFVSEKFAINAELGYGVALLKVGVTFKL